jgi:tRNA(Ile)-lysidine synthase
LKSTSGNAKPDSGKWDQLLQSIVDDWPVRNWSNVGVVVACSGGADSVALVRALHDIRRLADEANGFLVVANFDHGIRGEASKADQDFVTQLASDLGIRVCTETGTGAKSDEASLRDQRYGFLYRVAAQTGCRYIAFGHSLDDNVETVLHHLMRGTGPAGLTGIPQFRSADNHSIVNDFVIARPLLNVGRKFIRDALQQIQQTWREDASNADTEYQRNWIRAELIPLIQSRFPDAVDAIGRAIEGQADWRMTIESSANIWIQQNVSQSPLTIKRNSAHDVSIAIYALQMIWQQLDWSRTAMGQTHWQRLAKTIREHHPERYSLPGDIDVVASELSVVVQRSQRSRA